MASSRWKSARKRYRRFADGAGRQTRHHELSEPGLLDYEVGVAQLARRAALAVFPDNPDVPLVILEVADAAMCRRPNAASRRRGRRSAQSGWLFPFVRPEPYTADTPWTLERSLVGLPCDRPVLCISL